MTAKRALRPWQTTQTRENIVAAAQALFRRQGYDATTLEGIAERAGVHKQTVLRHFNGKAEIALRGQYEALAEFEAGLKDPARTMDAFAFWRRHIAFYLRVLSRDRERFRRHSFVYSTPELFDRAISILLRYETLLGAALAKEAGKKADSDVRAIALAAAAIFTYRKMNEIIVRQGAMKDFESRCLVAVDLAADAFARPADH